MLVWLNLSVVTRECNCSLEIACLGHPLNVQDLNLSDNEKKPQALRSSSSDSVRSESPTEEEKQARIDEQISTFRQHCREEKEQKAKEKEEERKRKEEEKKRKKEEEKREKRERKRRKAEEKEREREERRRSNSSG